MSARPGSRLWKQLLIAIAVVVVAACVTYLLVARNGRPSPSKPGHVDIRPIPGKPAPRQEITVYLPEQSGSGVRLSEATRTVEAKGDILDTALAALLATTSETGIAANTVPKGTKALGPVKVEGGVAVVNLSKEFLENFSGGSEQEAITLNAIAHTLVKNSGGRVTGVRILVENQPVDSLGGHFELTDPIRPDSTLLK